MTDDVFHLTPLDVRRQEFRRALRGYETLGVEDFRMRVADELERVLREKSVLEERVAALTEQLRVFRERETAMNGELITEEQDCADAAQQNRVENGGDDGGEADDEAHKRRQLDIALTEHGPAAGAGRGPPRPRLPHLDPRRADRGRAARLAEKRVLVEFVAGRKSVFR